LEVRWLDTVFGCLLFFGCEWLSLNGIPVTDAGLAHLHGLTGLRELQVMGTRVTDKGEAAIKKAIGGEEEQKFTVRRE
jgi:hypothetical protein